MNEKNGSAAILYAAKSTADPRGSIPTQLQDARTAAEATGFEAVAEYKDENESAYSGNRGDDLQRAMLHAVRIASEHGKCALVIQHSDRLARGDGKKAAHLVEYALWALKHDVEIVSVQDPQTFGDLLYAVVTGQRNHEDRHRKSEAVKSGLRRREATLLHHGGPRRYGYQYVRDEYGRTVSDQPMQVVPGEAPVVESMFRDFVAGVSQTQIARALNARGVRTAAGKSWYQSKVSSMLRNPLYAGLAKDANGALVAAEHEAIISRDLWERTQALLDAQARAPGKGRGRPPKARHLFVNGMLTCSRCGGSMVPRTTRHVYDYYYCSTRLKCGSDACAQTPIRRDVVDAGVFDHFANQCLDLEATRRDLEAAVEREVAATRELLAQAEHDERKAAERLARVKRDYMDGKLDAVDWQAFRDELTAEQGAARAELARLEEQERQITAGLRFDAEAETLRLLAAIRAAMLGEVRDADGVEAVRAALRRVFDGFELVGPDLVDGSYTVMPTVRAEAIRGFDGGGFVLPPSTGLNVNNKQTMASLIAPGTP